MPKRLSIAIDKLNIVLIGINDTGPINRKAIEVRKTPMITTIFPFIFLSHI